MRKFIVANLFSFIAVAAQAQAEDSAFINKISREILLHSKAYENLRVLTKKIGGRLAGSPQMVKAEQWGIRALQQANADTIWLQQCMVPRWQRGTGDEAIALIKTSSNRRLEKRLNILALGNSLGSRKPIEAEVVLINHFDELQQKQVKDKIVFFNYPFNPTYVRTFQAYADAVAYRVHGPSKAANHGAKAVMVRSMSHSTDNHPHTGTTLFKDSAIKIPAVAVGLDDADWLSRQLQLSSVFVRLQTHGSFLSDTIGHNIIAEWKGSEYPDEYITIGGHLDSWDVGEGAHDDGAGIVQTIEVLRALKALNYQPKRTLRFVFFANEENGLRGGMKYADEAARKGERHLFALESDHGGFTPRGFALMATNEQRKKMMGWKHLLAPYGLSEFGDGGGADIIPLHHKLGTALAGLAPDSQRYFDVHHAETDVFETVNKRELELGAVAMAALVYLVDQYGL